MRGVMALYEGTELSVHDDQPLLSLAAQMTISL